MNMNKKAMDMILVSLILGIVLISAAAIAFIPKINDENNRFVSAIKNMLNVETEETPSLPAGFEEQIHEGTEIFVQKIDYNKEGTYHIIKQAYNTGWNFEVHTIKTKRYPGLSGLESIDTIEATIILEHKSLLEILMSNEMYGIITINNHVYGHVINKQKELGSSLPDLHWITVTGHDDNGYPTGSEISPEEIQTLIFNDLYEKAIS